MDALESLGPIKRAPISGASSGANTLVAAVAGRKIRVIGLFLFSAGTVTVTIQTAAGGTALIGALPMVAQSSVTLPATLLGWCDTVAGDLLNMNLSTTVAITGCVLYQEV